MDLAALGEFDFIIAHGVYSWVPAEVQEALLSAFRGLLAPDGVAYMSYNVYPGWKAKEIDSRRHAAGQRRQRDAGRKVREARGMVDFLEEVAPADSVLARALAETEAQTIGFGDSYLLHDELEAFNAPCYFYEMVGRAGAHGLAYLAEAHPETMFPANFGPRLPNTCPRNAAVSRCSWSSTSISSLNRMFRRTLLIHAERAPQIRYEPGPRPLRPSAYRRVDAARRRADPDGHSRQEYLDPDGATLFTNDPGIKAALDALSDHWPCDVVSAGAGGCSARAAGRRGFTPERRVSATTSTT